MPAVKAEAIVVYIALSNILTNAIKYSDDQKDGRRVTIASELIEQENDTGFVQITVHDNGLGIPSDLLPRACQRDFRAHPGKSYGTGKGLFLTESTIRERGGEFEIDSKAGEWTEVRLRFRCISQQTENLLPEKIDTVELLKRNIDPVHDPVDVG